jgi:hypothetical protein
MAQLNAPGVMVLVGVGAGGGVGAGAGVDATGAFPEVSLEVEDVELSED